jgi:hypothetical protein
MSISFRKQLSIPATNIPRESNVFQADQCHLWTPYMQLWIIPTLWSLLYPWTENTDFYKNNFVT